MAGEKLQEGHQEIEPAVRHPILILGAGKGTGAEIAARFAREGYPLIIGTRSRVHFENVRETIIRNGGLEPQPFIADITDTTATINAYRSLQQTPDTLMHFFPLAADGLNIPGDFVFKRQVIPLRKLLRKRELTISHLKTATEAIKEFVQTEEIMKPTLDINYHAPLKILRLLQFYGHLQPESKIITLSSVISNICSPADPDSYPGPWFYFPVAFSKQKTVLELQKLAQNMGIDYVDLVVPEIEGTDVAKLIEGLKSLLDSVSDIPPADFPRVTKTQVADSVFAEFNNTNSNRPRVRTVFLDQSGNRTDSRPSGWDQVLRASFL